MKLGLEIHQRLNTHKLFCECPSECPSKKYNETENETENFKPKTISRMLHPVYSEIGEIDQTAVEAAEREQTFEYLFYPNCNCLVELDEEPPHQLNNEALAIGLEIAQQFNSEPLSEIHVMRKIVIDGSNTAGFQRTAIISLGGRIESAQGDVRIATIALEEESAGIVEKKEGKTVYSLERLGIPLIEISTEPDIKNPQHLKEIAEKIGLTLRATGKVMRGIGTIRQDVNISIEQGARVEIKGAQDLKTLPFLVENEVKRQQNLLEIISKIKFQFESKPMDISSVFATSTVKNTVKNTAKIINNGLQSGQKVFGIKLEKHAKIIGQEINPNRRYGTELSDYAKTAGVKGIIHSDEDLGKYGISEKEIEEVYKILNMDASDAFVIVVGDENIARKALDKIIERAKMTYIPKETRKANEDGTSSYMRPLPGKARLYPETDIPPIKVTEELLSYTKTVYESIEEKKERLAKLLNKDMVEKILFSKYLKLFERLVADGVEPIIAATTLEDTLTMLRREKRENIENIEIKENMILELFSVYKKNEFVKSAIPDILRELSKGKTVAQALDEKQLRKITGAELEKIVKENNKNFTVIMSKYRLRVDAKEVVDYIDRVA
ncbi:MAG: Glu-tRNA(Gln) amidotransferase subunit GatE [Candidatus Micrarchaeota archaeon]